MRPLLVLTIALSAGTAACTAPAPEIRMIDRPLQAGDIATAERIAEGNAMMRLGNVGLAIEAYRRARRTDPANPDVYVMLAVAYDRMGRIDLATANYEQAMALAPHRPDLYVMLAQTMSRANRPEEARALLSEAERRRAAAHPVTDPVANASHQRLERQIDAQQRRTAQVALTRRIEPRQAPAGPRLERAGPGATRLVTNDAPVWPEREDEAPAIAIAATKPEDHRPPAPVEANVAVERTTVADAAISETTIVLPAPAAVSAGPEPVVSVADAGTTDARDQSLSTLIDTVTLDEEAIEMLLDEGWIAQDEVSDLKLAQAARGATMAPMPGIAWCSR